MASASVTHARELIHRIANMSLEPTDQATALARRNANLPSPNSNPDFPVLLFANLTHGTDRESRAPNTASANPPKDNPLQPRLKREDTLNRYVHLACTGYSMEKDSTVRMIQCGLIDIIQGRYVITPNYPGHDCECALVLQIEILMENSDEEVPFLAFRELYYDFHMAVIVQNMDCRSDIHHPGCRHNPQPEYVPYCLCQPPGWLHGPGIEDVFANLAL